MKFDVWFNFFELLGKFNHIFNHICNHVPGFHLSFANFTRIFFAALAAFILLFAVRYLIGYILYTPDDGLFEEFIEGTGENNSVQEDVDEISERDTNPLNQSSKMEFQDESSEEIAKLVRSMLSE